MSFKLSIVIPTWNRLVFLKKNISRIIQEIETLEDKEIEIFISDNNSSDGTKEYLKKLINQYEFINVNFFNENMGANHNFYAVIKGASGDYVWLLGDDDMIVEGAINKIIQDINLYQSSVMLGGTIDDIQLKRIYLDNIVKHELVGEEVLKKFNAIELAGKMSVLIFSRTDLLQVLNEGMLQINMLKSPWPHLIWFLKLIAQGKKVLILPYPTNYIIKNNRFNNLQDGKERLALLFVDYAKLIMVLLPEFGKKAQKNLVRNLTRGRYEELVKNIAYSSFMNEYKATIVDAVNNTKYFLTFENKIMYFVFYLLPILLPVKFRLWCFKLPIYLKLNVPNYIDFIHYLEQARKEIKMKNSRAIFNRANL